MHIYIYRKCTLQTLRVWASGVKGAGGSPSLPPSRPPSLFPSLLPHVRCTTSSSTGPRFRVLGLGFKVYGLGAPLVPCRLKIALLGPGLGFRV